MCSSGVCSAALAVLLAAGGGAQRVEGEVFYVVKPEGAQKAKKPRAGQRAKKPQGGRRMNLGAVEVRFIPAAAMGPVMKERIAKATLEIESARPAVAELGAANAKAQEEALLALQDLPRIESDPAAADRWKVSSETAGDARAKYLAAREAMLRPTTGPYYVADLPEAKATATTAADGKFSVKLAPGRYAVVAAAKLRAGDQTETLFWLVWVTLERGKRQKITLSNDNLIGTSCPRCLVPVRQLTRSLP
jgi:hypothetical protein